MSMCHIHHTDKSPWASHNVTGERRNYDNYHLHHGSRLWKKLHIDSDKYGKCAWPHTVRIHVIILYWLKSIHLNRHLCVWWMLTASHWVTMSWVPCIPLSWSPGFVPSWGSWAAPPEGKGTCGKAPPHSLYWPPAGPASTTPPGGKSEGDTLRSKPVIEKTHKIRS